MADSPPTKPGAAAIAGARHGSVTHHQAPSIHSLQAEGSDVGLTSEEQEPIGFLSARGTARAKKPLLRSRKAKILCPLAGLIGLVVGGAIGLLPVLKAIATHTLSTSVLDVVSANITNPSNSSFGLTMSGQVRKVGIFPAHIHFTKPVEVYWIAPEDLDNEILLGSFPLSHIGVAFGQGTIAQETLFTINNKAGFARFTEYLITQEEFTWRLRSTDVKATAFGFIKTAQGLSFTKDLTLPAMANFTDVSISDFQLPRDDPEGGISLSVVTHLRNPSPFGVALGTLEVGLYYQGVYLGPAHAATAFDLVPGMNQVHLVGRMVSQDGNDTALAVMGSLFSRFLNGETSDVTAIGQSASLPSGEGLNWLSAGLTALHLTVPLVSVTGRISPITAITIGSLELGFDPATPWAPLASSQELAAKFALPFGFSLNITDLANSFTIVQNGTDIASILAPMGSAKTISISHPVPRTTTGDLTLALPEAPLTIPDTAAAHKTFSQFNYDLTFTNGSNFRLNGSTTVRTTTPIGPVTLEGIGFEVPAGLLGLEGLSSLPTTILALDVLGGTAESLTLNITVGLTNPSNLELDVGDVTFQLFNGEAYLGTAVLPSLVLARGYQTHDAVGHFEANANPTALATLIAYTQGSDAVMQINGYDGSTETASLVQALSALRLNSTLPGLSSKLLSYANLTVLASTGVTDNLANSVVELQNPFSSALTISQIKSNISAYGLTVGTIGSDAVFNAVGAGSSVSPTLGFAINLYPPTIFALLRVLVVEAFLDPAPLDGIVALGGYTYDPTTTARARSKRSLEEEEQDFADMLVSPSKAGLNPGQDYSEHMFTPQHELSPVDNERLSDLLTGPAHESVAGSWLRNDSAPLLRTQQKRAIVAKRGLYTGFDLVPYVLTAFERLEVDITLTSALQIGDFITSFSYAQSGVPAHTDSSLVLLLPILAHPIVQKLVDSAILTVTQVLITNPSEASFTAGLLGSITNAGPFNAAISFPEGLTVSWNGAPLGQLAMPPVALVEDVGASLNLEAAFSVADVSHLTEFTAALLNDASFAWTISGANLAVEALGITVQGITISKEVVLDGMSGFAGGVTINSFDLPANDPAGGITLTLETTIVNPSSVGIELSTLGFANYFGDTLVGPASSAGPFSLLPKATIALPLVGRLIPQNGAAGLADLSTIFNNYVHSISSNLVVHGDVAGPASVGWLNNAIKQLKIAVVLPAPAPFEVITAIDINSLSLIFDEKNEWDPAFSTSNTVASFQLPFAFPIDITQIETSITAQVGASSARLRRDAGDFATLEVPLSLATTDVGARKILLTFADIPFHSVNNDIFAGFLAATTAKAEGAFNLHGQANTLASTAIGDVSLTNIGLAVSTSLLGLQGFNARPTTVSDLDVAGGTSEYLEINVIAHLFNPSNLTIGTGPEVAFGLRFGGETIGTANIANLLLVPGKNAVATQVRYSPSGGAATAAGQLLLENYIQNVSSDTIIFGNSETTSIDSLKAALSTISLATTIPPLAAGNLITGASLTFALDVASSGLASTSFTLANPFSAAISIKGVLAKVSFHGIPLGQIDQKSLSPAVFAPGHDSVTSQILPFGLNTDVKSLIMFLGTAAAVQEVSLGPLEAQFAYVLGLESTESSVITKVNTAAETCAPTHTTEGVGHLILAAVTNLRVDLNIESSVDLGDYSTSLDFVQNSVPATLDRSVLFLTGLIGKTLVSHIVDETVISFDSAMITGVTNKGFNVALKGALTNAGPFDALILFDEPIQVVWQGQHIADLVMPPICSAGSSGATLDTSAVLTITDEGAFTDFATFLLLNPSFEWEISCDSVQVQALGTIFTNVALKKTISFSGFNGLPGVTIIDPDFPGDSSSGIKLNVGTVIPSASNIGIELGHVEFVAAFDGETIGPIDGYDLTLLPLASTTTSLSGTIIARTSSQGRDNLGTLFSAFLQGANQTLDVTGHQVTSPAQDSPISWLSAAFKKLSLAVILPGKVYDIISSVTLQDLDVTMNEASLAYAPVVSNEITNVVFKNPFQFSLEVVATGGDFIIEYGGVDSALLSLPLAPCVDPGTSSGEDAGLVINFSKATLTSLNNGGYDSFFRAMTAGGPTVGFTLHGAADVTARTSSGEIKITGVAFSVESTLVGINNFGGVATIPALPRVLGSGSGDHFAPSSGSEFLRIALDVVVNNPAPLLLTTNLVSFAVSYQGVGVGRAYVNPLNLVSGTNTLPSEFHYMPADPSNTVASSLLAQYIQNGGNIPLQVSGDSASSPYGPLQAAMSAVDLATGFNGAGLKLIANLALFAKATPPAFMTFFTAMNNPLAVPLTVVSIKGRASSGSGVAMATFDWTFDPPWVIPPHSMPSGYSGYTNATAAVSVGATAAAASQSLKLGLVADITAHVKIDGYDVPAMHFTQSAIPYCLYVTGTGLVYPTARPVACSTV